jgi:hypothetical protein
VPINADTAGSPGFSADAAFNDIVWSGPPLEDWAACNKPDAASTLQLLWRDSRARTPGNNCAKVEVKAVYQ